MTRKATDGLYIDLEYFTPEEYYAYVAEGEALLGNYYIEPGYIQYDYYDDVPGSVFSISCELTLVVGEVKEFDAALSATASVDATVGVIKQAAIDISGAMTVLISVRATRPGDIDLYPFFDFASAAERFRSTDSTLENIINLSLQSARTRPFDTALSASFEETITGARFSDVETDLASSFVLSVDATTTLKGTLNANSEFALNINADAYTYKDFSSDLAVDSTLYANPIKYVERDVSPRPVDWASYLRTSFNSTYKKYGTHSLYISGNANISEPAYLISETITDYFDVQTSEDFSIEFWFFYNVNSVTGTLFVYNDSFYISADYSSAFQQSKLKLNWYGSTITPPALLSKNTWYHFSVRRISGVVRFYINGVSQGSITDSRSFAARYTSINDRIAFQAGRTASTSASYYIDSFALRVGENTVNGYSAVPTNTEGTLMLTHFDNVYTDDISSGFLLSGAADLNSAFSVSANGGNKADAIALFASSGTLAAEVGVIKSVESALDVAATLSSTPGFVKEVFPNLEAIATELVVINKIGNTLVDILMTASLAVDAVEIVQLDSALAGEFTLAATVNKTVQFASALDTAFTITADTLGILDTGADLASAFTQTASASRTRSTDSTLDSAFTQTTEGIKAVEASAALSSEFTSTADNIRIRYADSELEAFATELAAVAKVGDFLITLIANASLSIDAVKKTGNVLALDAAFNQSASATRTRDNISTQSSQFDISADGISSKDVTFSADSAFNLDAVAVKTAQAQIAVNAAADFALTARLTRVGDIDIFMSSSITADANVIKGNSIAMAAFTTATTLGGRLREDGSNITAQFDVVAQGRLLAFIQELEYTIPREFREFAIHRESRDYKIKQETRQFTIQGA